MDNKYDLNHLLHDEEQYHQKKRCFLKSKDSPDEAYLFIYNIIYLINGLIKLYIPANIPQNNPNNCPHGSENNLK